MKARKFIASAYCTVGEISFESLLQQEAARKIGLKKLTEFLVRTVGKEQLSNPATFMEMLSKMNYEQFDDALARLNGLVNNILPTEREEMFKDVSRVQQGFFSDLIELQPPPPEVRDKLMREVFTKLHEVVEKPTPLSGQVTARTLFNSMIYLHPFKDGNGRTARLLYFLFSSHIPKRAETIEQNLSESMDGRGLGVSRSRNIAEYHWNLDSGTFSCLLKERGLSDDVDEEKHFIAMMRDKSAWGFDVENLGFIAAYDVMTPDERVRYAHKVGESGAFYFSDVELPEDLQKKIKKQQDKVREEFVRYILETSLSAEECPSWIDEDLDNIFGVTQAEQVAP